MSVPPSLFIVALPRSLSSEIFQVLRSMTGLKEAQWATDGEILNLDRHILHSHQKAEEVQALKYLRLDHSPETFHRGMTFLDDCTQQNGYIYKDVVQPFLLSAWPSLKNFNSIYVDRKVEDVAFSVLRQKWEWPAHALTRSQVQRHDVIRGLLLAQKTLQEMPCRRIEFEKVIFEASSLEEVLEGYDFKPVNYLTPDFCRRRDQTLSKRHTAEYLELAEEIQGIRETAL